MLLHLAPEAGCDAPLGGGLLGYLLEEGLHLLSSLLGLCLDGPLHIVVVSGCSALRLLIWIDRLPTYAADVETYAHEYDQKDLCRHSALINAWGKGSPTPAVSL